MAGKEIIEIGEAFYLSIQNKKIDEGIAHSILQTQQRILMVFRRSDLSLYGYEASEITDLNHAKKVQIVDFEGFFKVE